LEDTPALVLRSQYGVHIVEALGTLTSETMVAVSTPLSSSCGMHHLIQFLTGLGVFSQEKLGFSQVLLNFNQFHASPRVAQWLRSGSVAHRRWTRPESFSLASAMGQRRSWSWPAPGWGFEMAIGKVQ